MARISYIKKCVNYIEIISKKHGLRNYNGLELFAGNGNMYSKYLSKICKELEAWDIDPDKKSSFDLNVKNGNFICRNSIEYLDREKIELDKCFDIISIDNPLSFFGNGYCEHFDLIKNIYKLIVKPAVIAINIVRKPYNISQNTEWVNYRKKYYNIVGESLNLEYAKNFYINILREQGLDSFDAKVLCRERDNDNDYFYMYICYVVPTEKNSL